MKIAVCICGEHRFYESGKRMMNPFYEGCSVDYYIHSWAKENEVESNTTTLSNFFSPKKILVESYRDFTNYFGDHSIVNNSPNISNAVSWIFSVYQVGKLLEQSSYEYDYVVFTRTDVAAIGKKLIDIVSPLENKTIYSSYVNGSQWIIDKDHLMDGGILDTKLICSDKSNMLYYSKLYERLLEYVVKDKMALCHHHLIYHHMKPLIEKYDHKLLKLDNFNCGINAGWVFIRKDGYFQGD